jgi:hypothetical protein
LDPGPIFATVAVQLELHSAAPKPRKTETPATDALAGAFVEMMDETS